MFSLSESFDDACFKTLGASLPPTSSVVTFSPYSAWNSPIFSLPSSATSPRGLFPAPLSPPSPFLAFLFFPSFPEFRPLTPQSLPLPAARPRGFVASLFRGCDCFLVESSVLSTKLQADAAPVPARSGPVGLCVRGLPALPRASVRPRLPLESRCCAGVGFKFLTTGGVVFPAGWRASCEGSVFRGAFWGLPAGPTAPRPAEPPRLHPPSPGLAPPAVRMERRFVTSGSEPVASRRRVFALVS